MNIVDKNLEEELILNIYRTKDSIRLQNIIYDLKKDFQNSPNNFSVSRLRLSRIISFAESHAINVESESMKMN